MTRARAVRSPLTAALALAVAGLGAGPGAAQTAEVRLEVGASRILPPNDVQGDGADFLVAGLRASAYHVPGTAAYGSLLVGRSLDETTGGDFLSGEMGATMGLVLRGDWSAELGGRAWAFGVAAPFSYSAAAGELSAALRRRAGPISVRLTGSGGMGRSRVAISTVVQRMRRDMPLRRVLTDDLWRYGAALEALAHRGPLAVGVTGQMHETAGGPFRSLGARVTAAGRRGALELRVDAWRTPAGPRNTGGLAFWVPWGAWTARGGAGRPDPDPLLLADPARGSGGVLVGRRIAGRAPASTRRRIYRVVDVTATGARIRFTVEAPEARRVELLGDFTLWKAVPMGHRGRGWSLETDVPSGTHHFGFLVDGAWYVPEGAADVVPDEWGRRNATLVIEGEAGS